jgi:hypothetical protein
MNSCPRSLSETNPRLPSLVGEGPVPSRRPKVDNSPPLPKAPLPRRERGWGEGLQGWERASKSPLPLRKEARGWGLGFPPITPLTDKNVCSILPGKRHCQEGSMTWAVPVPSSELVLTSIEPGAGGARSPPMDPGRRSPRRRHGRSRLLIPRLARRAVTPSRDIPTLPSRRRGAWHAPVTVPPVAQTGIDTPYPQPSSPRRGDILSAPAFSLARPFPLAGERGRG